MKADPKVRQVQESVGRVQGQMRENIELALGRAENIDGLDNRSSTLRASASQFSQVASRIREEQTMQLYKFYVSVALGLLTVGVLFTLWSSPVKLLVGLSIILSLAFASWYFFQRRKMNTIALANSLEQDSIPSFVEEGRE